MAENNQENRAIIHVIDDNEAEREAASWFLRGVGYDTKTYENASTFLQTFDPKTFGLILLDIQMPGIDGIKLLEIVEHKECLMPIIMLSGAGTLQNAIQSMKSGALDFLEKPFDSKDLLSTVKSGLAVAHERFSADQNIEALNNRLSGLTRREREIYDHACVGESNKIISAVLGIHLRTVEFHRRNMMIKMKVENLEELIKLSK